MRSWLRVSAALAASSVAAKGPDKSPAAPKAQNKKNSAVAKKDSSVKDDDSWWSSLGEDFGLTEDKGQAGANGELDSVSVNQLSLMAAAEAASNANSAAAVPSMESQSPRNNNPNKPVVTATVTKKAEAAAPGHLGGDGWFGDVFDKVISDMVLDEVPSAGPAASSPSKKDTATAPTTVGKKGEEETPSFFQGLFDASEELETPPNGYPAVEKKESNLKASANKDSAASFFKDLFNEADALVIPKKPLSDPTETKKLAVEKKKAEEKKKKKKEPVPSPSKTKDKEDWFGSVFDVASAEASLMKTASSKPSISMDMAPPQPADKPKMAPQPKVEAEEKKKKNEDTISSALSSKLKFIWGSVFEAIITPHIGRNKMISRKKKAQSQSNAPAAGGSWFV